MLPENSHLSQGCPVLWGLLGFPPPRRVPGEWAAPFLRAKSYFPPRRSSSPSSSTAVFLFASATSFFSLFLPRARKSRAGTRRTRHQFFFRGNGPSNECGS